MEGLKRDGLTRNAWNPARQCTAMNRSGERCRRQPIAGGTVCVMHGGSIPQVQAAAKTRLLALVEPVLGVFEDIVTTWHSTRCTGCGAVDANGNVCRGCGKPTGDPAPVIRVAQLVLDRAGFHPTLTVEQAPPSNKYEHFSDDQLVEELEHMLAAAIETRDAHRQTQIATDAVLLPEAQEAVLLDDGFVVSEDDQKHADDPDPEPIHNPDVQIPVGNHIRETCIATTVVTNALPAKDL